MLTSQTATDKKEQMENNIYYQPQLQHQFNFYQSQNGALDNILQNEAVLTNVEFLSDDYEKYQQKMPLLNDDPDSYSQPQFPLNEFHQLIQTINNKNMQCKKKPIKKQKNSNCIKKLGRIILNNLQKYHQISKGKNNGVIRMLQSLQNPNLIKHDPMCHKRDRFNTYNYHVLINSGDQQLRSKNLKMTHFLLKNCLRTNILNSKQITNRGKIIYLNSLKGCELRCFSHQLSKRLQLPENEL